MPAVFFWSVPVNMPRDLKADQEMLQTVLELAGQRDFTRAAAIAEQALASGFEHPLLLNVSATRLELEGKFEDALRLLECAVALAPEDIAVRNALALCLQRLDRPADALQHLDKLLSARPDLGFAHAGRGNALIALGQLDSARQSHLRALELDPENLAAEASLASIATQRGLHAEARTRARKVLARVPGFPDAVLSVAAAELAAGSIDNAQILVCQLLADARAGAAEKARANGLLGDILDAAGRYPEAWAAYEACNAALRQIHRQTADAKALPAYLESVIAALGKTDPSQWAARKGAAAAVDPTAHVFLLGFPCSGTSRLMQALGRHPGVAGIDEQDLLSAGVLRFMREPVDFGALLQADERELSALREHYWREVRAAGVDCQRKVFIDRYPLHGLKLPLIARLFPDAKFLCVQRDPRDLLLACFRRRFTINAATWQLLTLGGGARLFDAAMRITDSTRTLLGLQWQELGYERLVSDSGAQLQQVCKFLGLEWTTGLNNDFEQSPSPIADPYGAGQWRHYLSALGPVLATLQPWMARRGYA